MIPSQVRPNPLRAEPRFFGMAVVSFSKLAIGVGDGNAECDAMPSNGAEPGDTARRHAAPIPLGRRGAARCAMGPALAVQVLLQAAAAAWGGEPTPGCTIGSITIETHNVFDTRVPTEDKRLFKMANGIHLNTREAVIRRELLFSVGDPYDPALVQETERNLRRLPFIRHADCVAAFDSRGTVDVIVRTYDAWALEVVANVKKAGGYINWKGGLADHNLLGIGKTLSGVYGRGDTTSSVAFEWKDPYFLGRKLDYSMLAVVGPESWSYSVGLNRPFYASIVRSAVGFSGNYSQNTVAVFSGGTVVGTVRKRSQQLAIDYGIALGTSTYRNRHLTVGLLHHRVDFTAVSGTSPGPIPDDEKLAFLKLGAEWEVLDFIKERHIQKFSHVEDINLGFGVFPSLSWAPRLHPLSSTQSQVLPRLVLRKGFRWTSSQLLLLHCTYGSTYSDGGNSNRSVSMDASYFVRGLPHQTLAFHSGYDHGWRLDPAAPLTLGERNGLRGYSRNQFTGQERLLFNIEDRIFIYDEVWRLIDVGAVVFHDSGYVWPSDRPARFSDLKSSLGFGLRLAPSRSSNNSAVRIDLAYAMSDNQSRSRWSLSVLGGLAFGPGSD